MVTGLGTTRGRAILAGGVAACAILATLAWAAATATPGAPRRPATVAATTGATNHPVVVRSPSGPRGIGTGLTNFHGREATVACSTCHATARPNIQTRSAADLDQFHQGLHYAHGNLTCLSCHNADNYDTLRLADSRPVEFAGAMALCSQCHGSQKRDYDMGLHGGMNGHWDLTRGGRTRNTCVNCHDPHAPAFPMVMPVLPPRDRLSTPPPRGPTAPPSTH